MNRSVASLARCFASLLAFTLLLLCGCGGMTGNPGNSQTASLRIVDGNGMMASVNVLIDGGTLVNNVTFLTNTGYLSVPAGTHRLTLNGWTDPPNPSPTETFAADAKTTLVFEGCGIFGRSGFELLTDDTTPPAPGNFKLRIVDGAIFAIGDLYVLPAGASPSGPPTISGLGMGTGITPTYHPFPAGTYHIVLTQLGNTIVQLDSGPIDFASGQNRTYYIFQNGGQTATPGVIFCDSLFKPILAADLN